MWTRRLAVVVLASLAAWLGGCGSPATDTGTTRAAAVPGGAIASVTLTPATATIEVGGAVVLKAVLLSAAGTPLPAPPPAALTWSVTAGATYVAVAGGKVTGKAAGSATVQVKEKSTGKTATAQVVVTSGGGGGGSTGGGTTYLVVDTGQTQCYNATAAIAAPASGAAFYGQDAQFAGRQASYSLSSDRLTVADRVTGLTWQRSTDTNGDGKINVVDKMTLTQAQARPAALNTARYGGYSDWRLPSIKELYSLISFRGTDPSGASGTSTAGLTPFIDTAYFAFGYGDTSAGERIIDAQYASSTLYTGTVYPTEGGKLFGVNFADGRIKGYGLTIGGKAKTFYVLCVRGNTAYGQNSYQDNGDQTVTDRATGLTWAKADSGAGMDWQAALAWVQARNAAKYLGASDWRLPNAKELQSLVDYTRCPDQGSPAIDPLFTCTRIVNEAGQSDYPCYWTSTTHASSGGMGANGVYVAFGRAMGYMGSWVDVHGAGAQRSDPKAGSAASYPQGHGPQGDAIRITNYVRLVRGTS